MHHFRFLSLKTAIRCGFPLLSDEKFIDKYCRITFGFFSNRYSSLFPDTDFTARTTTDSRYVGLELAIVPTHHSSSTRRTQTTLPLEKIQPKVCTFRESFRRMRAQQPPSERSVLVRILEDGLSYEGELLRDRGVATVERLECLGARIDVFLE